MTVGETLAGARTRAGLSVDELSERTKIRGKVILGIERDDYEACGGDLYVRGYVRVLAGAVGLDAQSLLREFDQAQRGGGASAPARSEPARSASARPAPEPSAPRQPAPRPSSAGWGSAPEPKKPDPRPSSPDSAGRFGRLQRLKRMDAVEAAEEAQAKAQAEALAQAAALAKAQAKAKAANSDVLDLTRAASPEVGDPSRARSPETLTDMMQDVTPSGSGASGASLRTTSFDMPALGNGSTRTPNRPAQRRQLLEDEDAPKGSRKGLKAVVAAGAVLIVAIVGGKMVSGGGGSGAAPSASPSAAATSQGPVGLPIAIAQAWGPNGTADGDNPVSAGYPITAGDSQPWITQQYGSAQFGGQKTGTGIMLDMGKVVTVSSVTIDLGSASGSALQLQAGTSTSNLASVANASNVGGTLALSPGKPVEARYLLVWFTQLPQASDGQYQASVYHIAVKGRS